MTTLPPSSGSHPFSPSQEGAIRNAIDLASQVDPDLGRRLTEMVDSGSIHPASGTVSRFAKGFTPGSSIFIDPRYVKGGDLDQLTLASLLAHEDAHVDQPLKFGSILTYLMTLMYDSYSLEYEAYKKELKFLLKLRQRYCHDSPEAKRVETEIIEVERRLRNLRRWGNVEGKHF